MLGQAQLVSSRRTQMFNNNNPAVSQLLMWLNIHLISIVMIFPKMNVNLRAE